MEAVDAATNKSVPWPYLVIDGGPGKEDPAFLPASSSGQTEGRTPRITRVTMPNHTIPAAEISDGIGSQPITVHVDRKGMTVTKIEVRVLHHLTGGDVDRYKLEYLPPDGTLDQYTLQPAFRPPPGQFGWGYYTVNVQVTVSNGVSSFVSDLWPQLTAH
jgi:hypothetical protein